jgi:hypothetical protein
MKTALVLIGLNILTFMAQWRMKRLENLNEELLMRLDESKEDVVEKSKHQNKKWSFE